MTKIKIKKSLETAINMLSDGGVFGLLFSPCYVEYEMQNLTSQKMLKNGVGVTLPHN